MLGDWDLQSTLLRRALQDGALRVRVSPAGEPLLAQGAAQLSEFERGLIASSRGVRRDWASRFVLPVIEEFATERLLETRVRPQWLMWAALILTVAAAFGFTRGWLGPALAMLWFDPTRPGRAASGDVAAAAVAAEIAERAAAMAAAGLAMLALSWYWRDTAMLGAVARRSPPERSPKLPDRTGQAKSPVMCAVFPPQRDLGGRPVRDCGCVGAGLVALALYAAGYSSCPTWHHRITMIDGALPEAN